MFSKRSVSLLFMLVLIFTWGSSFILMKKSLMFFPSNIVAAYRMTAAFVIMLIPALIYVVKIPRKTFLLLTLSGVLANGIPSFLFAYAQTGIESYVSGILNSTTTLFTLIIGVIFFGYKAKLLSISGVIVGFTGIIGLLAFAGGKSLSFNFGYGGYILVATFTYAININFIKRWLSDVPTLQMVSMVFFVIGIFSSIYLFGFSDFISIAKNTTGSGYGILYMSILGIVGSAIALLMYYHLIKIADILFVASITYMMPVISTLWGISDGEVIGLVHVAYIILILLGVFMVNYHEISNKIKNNVNKNID
jgi:drug/metabolite transporter (DMT)-like permease